jgi:hypothetical protein
LARDADKSTNVAVTVETFREVRFRRSVLLRRSFRLTVDFTIIQVDNHFHVKRSWLSNGRRKNHATPPDSNAIELGLVPTYGRLTVLLFPFAACWQTGDRVVRMCVLRGN